MQESLESGQEDFPATRRQVPIEECDEPLVELSREGIFSIAESHPYLAAGAPYGHASPYALRESAMNALLEAAKALEARRPGCKIHVHDAYRPLPVQEYMVEYETQRNLLLICGTFPEKATATEWEIARRATLSLWAEPNEDPAQPPPHSTGGAVDVTLVDANGQFLPMGGEIDHPENAHPDALKPHLHLEIYRTYDANRELLRETMESAGFVRLEHEWWHFSFGDQHWAWERSRRTLEREGQISRPVAQYGRADRIRLKSAQETRAAVNRALTDVREG